MASRPRLAQRRYLRMHQGFCGGETNCDRGVVCHAQSLLSRGQGQPHMECIKSMTQV